MPYSIVTVGRNSVRIALQTVLLDSLVTFYPFGSSRTLGLAWEALRAIREVPEAEWVVTAGWIRQASWNRLPSIEVKNWLGGWWRENLTLMQIQTIQKSLLRFGLRRFLFQQRTRGGKPAGIKLTGRMATSPSESAQPID